MNKRVLHVLLSPRAEGTPRLVLDWLIDKNIEQGVILLNGAPDDLLNDFELSGSKLFILKIQNSGYGRFLKISEAVHKICLEFIPDLIIAWPQSMGGAIIWGIKNLKIKSIIHIGCYPRYNTPFQVFYNYFVYIPILIKNGRFVCASNFLRRRLLQLPGIPEKRISTIYNAIKLDRFLPGLEYNPIKHRRGAIMVANLETFKNQLFLIDVWAEIRNKGYLFTLTLVGGGSLQSELESKIDSLGLGDLIKLTGPVNNVPKYLYDHKLFLFPTDYTEGFGTVLIEALAAGCIVIANDVPSCREVLQDGKWGHLVPYLDKEKFSKMIINEMASNSYRYEISILREYLKEFETTSMIKKYLEFAD